VRGRNVTDSCSTSPVTKDSTGSASGLVNEPMRSAGEVLNACASVAASATVTNVRTPDSIFAIVLRVRLGIPSSAQRTASSLAEIRCSRRSLCSRPAISPADRDDFGCDMPASCSTEEQSSTLTAIPLCLS